MKHYIGPNNPMRAQFEPRPLPGAHFAWSFEDGVGTITLNRPERKNPLTFDSYAELRDLFHALRRLPRREGRGGHRRGRQLLLRRRRARDHRPADEDDDARAAGVHPHDRRPGQGHARNCPQPIVGAIDGICAGAGAMMALACDLRYGTPATTKTAFLFTRVGLAGADMGACALLPRVIGQGRASRAAVHRPRHDGEEGLAWGFFNALHDSAGRCWPRRRPLARSWPPAPPSPTA
jgi:enoyl-CoA hydratase/carnithine racemase